MPIFNRQSLTAVLVLLCNCGVFAQQQSISEKVAEQSAAAQAILDSVEKPGLIEMDRQDADQQKTDQKLFRHQPSFARIPTNMHSQVKKTSAMNRAFAKIKQMIGHGEQFVARRMLEEFVSSWPANTEGRLLLAKLDILQGNLQQAQVVLAPLMTDKSSGWQAWFWSATAKLKEGLVEQARRDLKQAAARDASVPDIWIQQAVVEQKSGNYVGAVQLLQVARQLAPGNPGIHLNLAFSNEQLGAYSSAVQNYQRFMQTSKDSELKHYQQSVVRRISELVAAL